MKKELSLSVLEYNTLIKDVEAFCKKFWKREGYPFYDDLRIPSDMKDEYQNTVGKYSNFIFNELYKEFWKEGFKVNSEYEVLPEWYYAPEIPWGSIFWRMGSGETYNTILYQTYLATLTQTQREEWETKYPEPCFYDEEYLSSHYDEILKDFEKKNPKLYKELTEPGK